MTRRVRSAQSKFGLATANVTGTAIRRVRRQQFGHLTGHQFCDVLADATGLVINHATLSKIERGTRAVYDYELKAFALLFQLSTEDLYEGLK